MTKKTNNKLQTAKGFTLLEILLVIALIGILASIVIIAINISKQLTDCRNTQRRSDVNTTLNAVYQLADGRNAQRRSDVNTILNAVYQYAIDNTGIVPAAITSTPTAICKTGGTCTGLIDLSVVTTNEKYITSMPYDPTTSTTNSTDYNISKSTNNRITVSAPGAENSATISVTR